MAGQKSRERIFQEEKRLLLTGVQRELEGSLALTFNLVREGASN